MPICDEAFNELVQLVRNISMRLERLEDKVQGIQEEIVDMRLEMQREFNLIYTRFDTIDNEFARIDNQFAMIDQKFERMHQRFDEANDDVDALARITGLSFKEIDKKLDRHEHFLKLLRRPGLPLQSAS